MTIKTRTNRPNNNGGSTGQFMRSRPRMVHVSARIIDNPLKAIADAKVAVFKAVGDFKGALAAEFRGPERIAAKGVTYRAAKASPVVDEPPAVLAKAA